MCDTMRFDEQQIQKVIEQLQYAYNINRMYEDTNNKELCLAIDRVLKYYMTPSEYEDYKLTLDLY